jgi:hypothetical protein
MQVGTGSITAYKHIQAQPTQGRCDVGNALGQHPEPAFTEHAEQGNESHFRATKAVTRRTLTGKMCQPPLHSYIRAHVLSKWHSRVGVAEGVRQDLVHG